MKTRYPCFEVVVVDCLTRGISEWAAEKFPAIKLIHFNSDIGPAASHNMGAAHAEDDTAVFAFLDNDTTVDPEWLTSLVRTLQSDTRIGAAQATIRRMDNPERLWALGETIDHTCNATIDENILRTLRNRMGRKHEIFNAIAAGIAVKRDVFQGVRGFDDAYFIFHDDVDLGWRIRLAGFRIVTASDSVVNHRAGGTPKAESRAVYFGRRNAIRTLLKNYDRCNAFLCVISRLLQDLGILLGYLVSAQPRVALAIAKAACWNLWHFSDTWRER